MTRQDKAIAEVVALVRARNTLLWIVSDEETRVENALIEAASTIDPPMDVRFWDCYGGFQNAARQPIDKAATDPEKAIKAVRAAATKAKDLSAMLTPEAAAKIEEALEAARSGARTIVKKTKDLDAQIAARMVEIEQDKIRTARFAFLEAAEASVDSLPSIDLGRGASLELGPDAVAREEVMV